MKAWHFVGDTLRDGSPVPADGVTLTHDGPLVVCKQGFHASERIIDALTYAPGDKICRVEVEGCEPQGHNDKLVCRSRTILWRIDGETVLREFVRKCALDVIHLWDAPNVMRKYLETGDESKQAAAWAAARAAASAAASAAARNAARNAAWDAAWAAARDAQDKRLTEMVMRARAEGEGR